MLCEHYKEILIDAVAAGDPLPLDLRTHLDSCASCRTAFDEECHLLAAIDSGIRAAASSIVPPSLLPAVHLRLAQEDPSHAHRSSSVNWVYLAAAAAAVLIALLPLPRLTRDEGKTMHQDAAASVASSNPQRDFVPRPGQTAGSIIAAVGPRTRHGKTAPAIAQIGTSVGQMSVAQMQVLVPPDQELLLADYARALQQRSLQLRTSNLSEPSSLGLPIDLIEVAQVQLLPLPDLDPIEVRQGKQFAHNVNGDLK
jgi:hypothetical protein